MPVISYPIPPYSNVNINAQYYSPSEFFISAISLGQQTTITTSGNHNFVVGQLVRLVIPPSFGTRQLNGQSGYVLSIPAANQVLLNINSSNADPFIASSATTKAQILAMGDVNSGITTFTSTNVEANNILNLSTNIPGSFINISPL